MVRFRAKFTNLQQYLRRSAAHCLERYVQKSDHDSRPRPLSNDVLETRESYLSRHNILNARSIGQTQRRPFPRRSEAEDRERRQGGDLANFLRPLNAERRTPNAERRKLLTLSWGSTSINVWIRPACLCYLLLENSTLVNPYAVV
jgi:hypothetical protein